MPYIGKSPTNGVRNRFQYTATSGQTSFSGADDNALTLTYSDTLYMDVYQNGILLVPGDDYTATTGTSVVLVQSASLNDVIEIVVYDVFSVADTVSKANGGTFSSNIAIGGTLDVTGTVTAGAVAVDNITIDATEIDSTGALTLDSAGTITLDADSGSINLLDGGTTHAELINSSNDFIIKSSQSDKDIIFKGVDGISLIEAMRIDMSEAGKVGIGTDSPTERLSVVNSSGDVGVRIQGNTRSFKVEQNNYGLRIYDISANSERFRINAAGLVTTPLQSAFSAQPTSNINNITGDATTASLTNVDYTEYFDVNADFNHNDGANRGKFTAPVTGKYYLGYTIFYSGITSASTSGVHALATSNRVYNNNFNPYNHANIGVNGNIVFSAIVDMDANDTAHVTFFVNGNGSKVVDIEASQHKFFGMLIG